MAGLLITLLFSLGCAGLGKLVIGRWLTTVDPAANLGLTGLTGLGFIGTLSLFIGLIPSGTHFGLYIVAFLALGGIALIAKDRNDLKFEKPKGAEWGFIAAFVAATLITTIGALAPSTMTDWDTLAYHLAVPKIWILDGQIHPIPYIHHSNFPQAVDNLYLWGLQWGGQSGAKAFSVAILFFGLLVAFGLGRQQYGKWAGWWSALGIASVPLIVWESGTAYIDVAHGLYAGLGIYFGAKLLANLDERKWFWLAAIFLALAAGSKYTGLQSIFAVSAVIGLGSIARSLAKKVSPASGIKLAVLLGFTAVAFASPWYIRNEIWKRNPVFPFFYSKLGGDGWDQRRADTYTHEQNTFGVGRVPAENPDETPNNPIQPTRIGHAILGLAYQPGRYINRGQTRGEGTPLGAVGVVLIAAMLAWMLSGKSRAFEFGILGSSLLTLAMWFVLSEQSRYVIALALPLAVLLGGAITRLKVGQVLACITALQAVYCLWLVETLVAVPQLPVVTGSQSADDYQKRQIPFYEPSLEINKLPAGSKLALYDEVFGFLLDVPYVWANPGHSTLIPYDTLNDGPQFAAAMKSLGFTHIFVNLSSVVTTPDDAKAFLAASGLTQPPAPYQGAEIQKLNNFEAKWKLLVADAALKGQIRPINGTAHWVLFEVL